MHHRLAGESNPSPTIQYLLPSETRILEATLAVMLPPEGSSSMRTIDPGFSGRDSRTPQPFGFTSSVWQRSENLFVESRLVMRKGICARTLVPRRRCTSSGMGLE